VRRSDAQRVASQQDEGVGPLGGGEASMAARGPNARLFHEPQLYIHPDRVDHLIR
jgi:hypothetical protein